MTCIKVVNVDLKGSNAWEQRASAGSELFVGPIVGELIHLSSGWINSPLMHKLETKFFGHKNI